MNATCSSSNFTEFTSTVLWADISGYFYLAHCTKAGSFKKLNDLPNTKIYVCVFRHIKKSI